MDNALVFFRTVAGEAAVRQPTRIVQRNLRTALMLVDGRRQVADIVARFGDIAVGEAALADLLRSGLIESAEMRCQGATGATARAPENEAGLAVATTLCKHPLPSQVTETDPRAAMGIVESITIGDPEAAERRPFRAKPVSASPLRQAATAPASRAAARNGARRSAMVEPEGRDRTTAQARARRHGWTSIVLALLVLLGLSIGAGVRFYPLQRHLPQLEQRLSAALGEAVTIGQVRLSLAPRPGLTLEQVSIGSDARVTVGALHALPDPLALWAGRLELRYLQLERLDIAGRDLALLAGWLSGAPQAKGIGVSRLQFSDATVRFPDLALTGLQGEASGAGGGALGTLQFTTGDGGLKGELVAADAGYHIKLSSRSAWAPGFLAPLAFDYFDAEGILTQDALRLNRIYGRVADGSVVGDATVTWSAKTHLSARLEMKHVSLNRLLTQSKSELLAQGSASGMLKVGGEAAAAGDAGIGLVFEGNVTVQHGALQGFDLVEAVRSGGGGTVRGGSTRFEEFTGQLRMDRQAWRISRLRLQSGLMSADGQVTGGRNQKVAGLVNVELRGSAGRVRVPVAVTGSLRDPVLSASRGAAVSAVPEPS